MYQASVMERNECSRQWSQAERRLQQISGVQQSQKPLSGYSHASIAVWCRPQRKRGLAKIRSALWTTEWTTSAHANTVFSTMTRLIKSWWKNIKWKLKLQSFKPCKQNVQICRPAYHSGFSAIFLDRHLKLQHSRDTVKLSAGWPSQPDVCFFLH